MQMLFTILKRKIFSILKLFNVELKIKKNLVKYNSYNAIHSFLASYFIKKSNFTFFDIGAHKGESIERFKKILKNITIHAFEPTPNLFELLKKKYSKENIFLNNLAVSDNDQTQTLYSYKHTLMNSMFPVKSNSKFQKSRILSTNSNTKEFEEKIEVKSITIDSYCNKNNLFNDKNIRLTIFLTERYTSYWFSKNVNTKYLSFARLGKILLSNNINKFINPIKIPFTFRMYPTLHDY